MAVLIKEDPAKFRELILYICSKCAGHQKFGATKLNKMLFYSDFLAFRSLGHPITGMEYQKLPKGPAPRRMLPIQSAMEADGELVIQPRRLLAGKIQKRPINLRQANLSLFTAEEIALVDEIVEVFKDFTANETSDFSHEEIGWKAARQGETIPYATIFISAKRPTAIDLERAARVEAECSELLTSIA